MITGKDALTEIEKRKEMIAAAHATSAPDDGDEDDCNKVKEKERDNNIGELKTYKLEELLNKEFCKSNGIDYCKREIYLSDQDFENIFQMKKEEFDQLKPWKKNSLKRKYKLF